MLFIPNDSYKKRGLLWRSSFLLLKIYKIGAFIVLKFLPGCIHNSFGQY